MCSTLTKADPVRPGFSSPQSGTACLYRLDIVQDTFNTQTEAGNTLADLVLGDIDVPDGRGYLALRRGEPSWAEPSVLARSDEQAERLWRESARLVGLPDRQVPRA